MSGDAHVARWSRPTRVRAWWNDAALGVPLAVVAVAAGWRGGGIAPAAGIAICAAALLWLVAWWRARRFDRRWLIAALDAARGDFEDSSDLLFADPAMLTPLQRMQQRRVAMRAEAGAIPVLVAPRDRRIVVAAFVAAAIAAAALIAWPRAAGVVLAPASEGLAPLPGVPRLRAQAIEIRPPAYTGLPARTTATLDARVPAGSRLRWTLRFDPMPTGATLAAVGRAPIAVRRDGDDWHAAYDAAAPLLYRVSAAGAERAGVPPLHRIDVVPDRPPQVRILSPATALTMLTAGQRGAAVAFAASDDYGVAATARLRIVVAQGEGENVRFSERTVPLAGSGSPRDRRFVARIDFAALGFVDPGDVVVQLVVGDMRTPAPQIVRGPSVILRRAPAVAAQGAGLEAMTRRVMPAYFRSQRQIIIDAEALLAERPRPPADRFASRSDAIGEDQRLLRMRYGQFMGEEAGGGATNAMPTNDEEEGAPPPAAAGDAHAAPHAPQGLGVAGDVTAEYGHTHDESEAATLLDPGTRATLRQALDAMWQSERALRQGSPAQALPFAYKALRFIKQVQQATRIFLARTGSDLPPIDPQRRLTGVRGDMGARTLPSAAATPVDPTPAAIWQALDTPRHEAALAALSRWLAANSARVPDPLALAAAIDTLGRRPGCASCRETLRAALWPALPRPVPGLRRRDAGDAAGRRYLEALP